MAPQHLEGDEDVSSSSGNDRNLIEDDEIGDEMPLTSAKEEDDGTTARASSSSPSRTSQHSATATVSATTFALCACMFAHSYLLISVFPYSGFLAIHLLDIHEDESGKYAGILASAFMVGRALTSFLWGKLADRFGRIPVMYLSLILSGVFSLLFGVATSFSAAVFLRFCLGLSNGIMTTVKTVVSEISDQHSEAKTMSVVVGMWGWGFLISPAISGALAEPTKQYPDSAWLQNNVLLHQYPFLLPNLVGFTACLLAILLIRCFVHETLPASQRLDPQTSLRRFVRRIRHCCRSKYRTSRYDRLPTTKVHQSDRELSAEDEDDYRYMMANKNETSSSGTTVQSLLSRSQTRSCLWVFWAYSFVSLTVDESFPLFCLSHTAGFGIPEKEIGKILSACGLIFAVCQYFIYTKIYDRFGLYGSMRVGSSLSAPLMFLVPLSLLLNRGRTDDLQWSAFVYLASLLAMYRCFALVFFSSISVALNRSVPASARASLNGLSVLGGSFAKGLGPMLAGVMTTTAVSWLGKYASLLVFGMIGVLGLLVAVSCYLFLHEEPETIDDTTAMGAIELEENPSKVENST